MKITYIWHDCFIVETSSATLLFDYWKEPENSSREGGVLSAINPDLPLYVFVSHHHKDHLNPEVFGWGRHFPSIRFLISRDVEKFCRHYLRPDSFCKGEKADPSTVTVLQKGEEWSDGVVHVKAFGSTDIGNSYLAAVDGERIFHAGDLNAWVWIDESTEEEIERAVEKYNYILEDIRREAAVIDYAFFPADPRLGTHFYMGAEIFVRSIDVRHFFPMHFTLGEDEAQQREYERLATDFSSYANPRRGEYIPLTMPYRSFVANIRD